MSDRFKFRVWDIEEWGYLKCKYSKSAGYHKYTFGKHDVWHDIGYFIENNPKYYIVEQCTGLKDKNGKLIFEGDIVRYWWNQKTNTGTIFWNNEFAHFCIANNETHCQEDSNCFMFVSDKKIIEIIGNIHEQAEQKE